MSQIVLCFLCSTSVLSFYIDVVLTRSIPLTQENASNNDVTGRWTFPTNHMRLLHDDVIKWKHFPRYWPFVRGINRPPVNSPHKGQ